MSFDPQFARDTVLPLVQAAYQVFHNPDVDPTLPAGYQKPCSTQTPRCST
jgi:hypothetical protein